MKLKKWTVLFLFNLTLISCSSEKVLKIESPDNKIKVSVNTSQGIYYTVNFKDSVIINPSKLGYEFKNANPLSKNFIVTDYSITQSNTKWTTVWGEKSVIEDNYNQLLICLQEKDGFKRKLNLYFKIYNDGIGFRYEIPKQKNIDSLLITQELTEFNFVKNHSGWYIPANFESYETLYKNASLNEIESANTPITLETEAGNFISIHEANLTNYAGMTLKKNEAASFSFKSDLVPWPNGVKVKAKTPMVSPWRTIQITDNAKDLVESNLILNLNEPNKIENVSWIEPMKYIGIWWGMHLGTQTWTLGERHGATTEETKKYIDFADKHKIKGVLVEGWNTGWENWGKKDAFDFVTPYDDFNLKEVTNYATEKNISFIGHVETGGAAQSFENKLDPIFSMYQQLGVKAVKTGYAGGIQTKGQFHHGQFMVNHYREVVKTAAKYKIMIDAHEPIKPTGIRRTYPNMMTREGTRGMEWNAWSSGNPPEHYTILPFTRGLAGPIDYTPGVFDILYKNAKNRVKWNDLDDGTSRVNTTLAKQLALFVVLYSPMQMASDLIENYENQPAFKFIEDVATDWEFSKMINGKIGDYITIVRKDKNSDDWFLGSITDESQRELNIELSFLEENKTYIAQIYADGTNADWETNPTEIDILKKEVTSKTNLNIKLAAGGGQAIRFTPINK
ncbi:alpha-glucosidase [Polaribacter sp. ALD11]|uniref:glycoside hydrolase family 97 protein n=1 Tax=Polaribacter sp. ALD11 TaxID=2058137 RepID=UPI000C309CC7|nr:glycoside hydrolase family 97 protein [Polaribacter sp. ALD11]AUC83817.1 alpha-glucosidase [Polaribacter sp. ALD11]